MVMVLEVIATGSSYGMELMIRQRTAKLPARCSQSIVKAVVRIVHLIDSEHSFQTTFVEAGIMSHEWDSGNLVSYIIKILIRKEYLNNSFLQLLPYFGKHRRTLCITFRDAMYPLTPIVIIVRLRLDQTVERVNYLPITHHDHSDGADT